MADSAQVDEKVNAGSRPVSQTPGQGSSRLATIYAFFAIPTAVLGLLMLVSPYQSASLLFGSALGWVAGQAASSLASLTWSTLSALATLAVVPLRVLAWVGWRPRVLLGRTLGPVLGSLLQGFNWTDTTISSVIGLSISRILQGWLGWFLGFSWVRNIARQAVIFATGGNFTTMGQNLGGMASDAIQRAGVPVDATKVASASAGLGEIADGVFSPKGSAVVEGLSKVAEAAVGADVVQSVGETLEGLKHVGQEALSPLAGAPDGGASRGLAGALASAFGPQGLKRALDAAGLSHLSSWGSSAWGAAQEGLPGNDAFHLRRDVVQTVGGEGGLRGVAAKIGAATPEGRMYSTLLRILGVALLSATVIQLLLARAAQRGDMGKAAYVRLNTGLALWSLLSLVLLLCSPTLLSVLSFLTFVAATAGTLAITVPQLLSTNASGALDQALRQVGSGRTRRGWIFGVLSLVFVLEGLGLVLTPGMTLGGAFGLDPNGVGRYLWQLIGASAHVLVPLALLQLAGASEKGILGSPLNMALNKVVFVVAATHVLTLMRHALFGPVGPLGPPVLLAWASALGVSIYNLPTFGHLNERARVDKQA